MRQRVSLALAPLLFLAGCGWAGYQAASTSPPPTTPSSTTYTWSADIAPIVNASCATRYCHGQLPASGVMPYLTQAGFVNDKSNVLVVLSNGSMPPLGIPALAAGDSQKLSDYLNQPNHG